MKPHKCPVCNGTGTVSRSPEVSGDVLSWVSGRAGPYPCNACGSSGIVWEHEETSKGNFKAGKYGMSE